MFCENGEIKPGKEVVFGNMSNYPEINCCGCGKLKGKCASNKDGNESVPEVANNMYGN